MKARSECLLCLLKQAHATAKIAGKSDEEAKAVVLNVAGILPRLDSEQTPPALAVDVYESIAKTLGDRDPYKAIKARSIELAKALVSELDTIESTLSPQERLQKAIRIAVLGNVIDYGASRQFSLKEEAQGIFKTSWACDDSERFFEALKRARNILYIGDNAGENIFDKVLLREMRAINPSARRRYFTRGRAIINDLTFEEAQACEMEGLCELVDSGVPSPGFVYALANAHAREIYDEADLILSKGMGNFEVLESHPDERLFMLFKVKCEVVARHAGYPLGSFVFRQNIKHERGV